MKSFAPIGSAIFVRIAFLGNWRAGHAKFQHISIPKPGLRIVSTVVPTPARPTADGQARNGLSGVGIIPADHLSCLRIESLREIVVLDKRPDVFKLAVVLVHDEHEAAFV